MAPYTAAMSSMQKRYFTRQSLSNALIWYIHGSSSCKQWLHALQSCHPYKRVIFTAAVTKCTDWIYTRQPFMKNEKWKTVTCAVIHAKWSIARQPWSHALIGYILTQTRNFRFIFVSVNFKCMQAFHTNVCFNNVDHSAMVCAKTENHSMNISANDNAANTSTQISKVTKSISRVFFMF